MLLEIVTSLIRNSNNKKRQDLFSFVTLDSDDEIQQINQINDDSDKILVPLKINGINCKLECDSGSRKTIESIEFFNGLNLNANTQLTTRQYSFSRH